MTALERLRRGAKPGQCIVCRRPTPGERWEVCGRKACERRRAVAYARDHRGPSVLVAIVRTSPLNGSRRILLKLECGCRMDAPASFAPRKRTHCANHPNGKR